MKPNLRSIAGIAVFALASLSPVAFASPRDPFMFRSKGSQARPSSKPADCCAVNPGCNDKKCCNVKTVSVGPRGSTYDHIRGCTKNCPIAAESQPSVCRKGKRA